jgi:5-carboxymethyl-2-hydroxymuconic-semialdehyde dehydrogenase
VVAETVRQFIGGKYAYSTLRKSYGVTDPATGKEYAQVEVGLGADVNQAVLAARAALETGPWRGVTAPDRARVLHRIADAIDTRMDDIAAAEALGPGLPVAQAREQAAQASGIFRLAAETITEAGRVRGPDELGYLAASPAGIAGLITSWRTPFLAQARAVASALAAGCTIVLKPDEWAPLPAALLAEIAIAAGLPDGVLNIVHGSLHPRAPGAQARDALIAHPSVARLSFDGDAATGRQITLDAVTHRKRLSAQLAGNAPCLIFADADLDRAVDSAVFGAFALNGSRRTATSTILVQRPVYDTIVSRLAQRAERIRAGDPADPETELGPLPDGGLVDALAGCVRLGVREGARLAAGGRRPAGLPDGNYFAATVLADVEPSMRIFGESICGPALRVTPFETDEEAVSIANAVTDVAAAYLWTSDLERARRLAPAFETPGLWVNAGNHQDRLTADGGRRPGGPGGPSGPDVPDGSGGPGGGGAVAGDIDIDFYTRTLTVRIAADDTPVPRFGA